MSLALSITVVVVVISFHLLAFVFAVGAEYRRNIGKVVQDQYDEYNYCVYETDASTVYGLCAFGLLLISHTVVNGVTKCFCFGKGLTPGRFKTLAVFFYVFSWLNFLGAEACLLGGSARNAYHTKYQVLINTHLLCATLRKGVFAAAAALTLLSMIGSVAYYWAHSRADTGDWWVGAAPE
uniref:Uncharacterized protein n=1 Tax=Kalanchoe fedtschenkoi TaxID=63787 RepID=A0A7N0UUU0_KALFE